LNREYKKLNAKIIYFDDFALFKLVIDSNANLMPSGILDGTFYSFGEYEECLHINHSFDGKQEIFGKYCLIKVQIPIPQLKAFLKNNNLIRKHLKLDQNVMINIIDLFNYANGTIFNLGLCFPHSCMASEIENLMNKCKFCSKKLFIKI
jgi:hypothetical protein